MKCPRCSTEIPNGIEVCSRCGFIFTNENFQQNNTYQNQSYNQNAYSSQPDQMYSNPANQNFNNQGYNNPVNQNYQNQNYGNPANQGYNNQPYNAPVNQNGPMPNVQNKPPKKNNRVAAIVVGVIAFVVFFGIAFTMSGGSSGGSSSGGSTPTTQSTTKLPNSEYMSIFTERNIVEPIDMFFGLESTAFAKVGEDGIVEKMALGYDGDTVKEMHDIVYLSVADYTDEQKVAFEEQIRKAYAKFEKHEFCTIVYTPSSNYLMVNITFKDVDNKDNIAILEQLGMIAQSDVDEISVVKTRENLIAGGFVEK